MRHWFPILFLLLCHTALANEIAALTPATTEDEYVRLSAQVRQFDSDLLSKELAQLNLKKPTSAPHTKRFGFDPAAPIEFFKSAEGQRIADIVLSFQTPSGGWSKRTDMSLDQRQPGQAFGVEKNYIPTFDNGATSTQVWLLAKAYSATGKREYALAVERAIQLIILAQYPNGGWPQNFPLSGGYHDYITYNDDAMVKLLQVLDAARQQSAPLDFINPDLAARAEQSFQRGLHAVVATQVKVDGELTLWGAQHHHKTLEPINARKFEPVALATAESADLVIFLMSLEKPSSSIKQAISAAHSWFSSQQIFGYQWGKQVYPHNALTEEPGAGPLWARFCEIGSNRPIFGDRDGSLHYNVMDVSEERRDGYAWYTSNPKAVLKAYDEWRARHLD